MEQVHSKTTLGSNGEVTHRRKTLGLSIEELAVAADLPAKTLRDFEAGTEGGQLTTYIKAIDALKRLEAASK